MGESRNPSQASAQSTHVSRVARRLVAVALLCAVLFPAAMTTLLVAGYVPDRDLLIASIVAAMTSVASLVAAWLARRPTTDPGLLLDVGLVYEVITAFGIAFAEVLVTHDPDTVVRGVSWVAIWILVYPVIIPHTPMRTLAAALLAASMGPIALVIVVAVGAPPVSPSQVALLYIPNYVAAGLALVASRLIHSLGREAHAARTLGAYELIERIGSGAMGEVWRARHEMLARPAAVKLVRPERLTNARDDTLVKRFEREARTTAALRSPHTIELYDFGIDDGGTLYYVMELLDGLDLQTLVDEHGPMPPERVVHVLDQVCDSLGEAHDAGLVHRDIKPENLYLQPLGPELDLVKVLDFGLVRPDDTGDATRLTGDQAIGTPAYMAPEMILGEGVFDRRLDLYALGCVAWFLLTGRVVFEGDSALAVIGKHVKRTPDPPSAHTEQEIPRSLDRLILRCLEKDPDARPTNAAALRDALALCDVPQPWNRTRAERWWRDLARD